MTTDELMPSPLKRTLVAFASGYKSAARMVGAMRRPYAITSQGTSATVVAMTNEITIAAAATPMTVFEATVLSGRLRTPSVDTTAAIAAAPDKAIRICWDTRVPHSGIKTRLKASAPAMEPAVFAA